MGKCNAQFFVNWHSHQEKEFWKLGGTSLAFATTLFAQHISLDKLPSLKSQILTMMTTHSLREPVSAVYDFDT